MGGRIWILWKPNLVDILFLDYNAQYIHMSVTNANTQLQFYYTMVYAFNGDSDREELWLNLRRISNNIQGPWVVGGDFNFVTQAHERLGGNVTSTETEPFQNCIEDCDLSDMSYTGVFYTWNNKQPLETRVYSRLDMRFVNHSWRVQMPAYFANFLPEGHFDHTSYVVSMDQANKEKNRSFKYFNM
ncbi:uncharacterized protein LOC141631643 [Silene latifolia]|uniref:uncharacterized protein LOC141631643 n=1 Tax=Silene latifolia TaxID=37657 RepID=UPI003D785AC4